MIKDLMSKFRMNFDQAIHQELARIINLQTLFPDVAQWH